MVHERTGKTFSPGGRALRLVEGQLRSVSLHVERSDPADAGTRKPRGRKAERSKDVVEEGRGGEGVELMWRRSRAYVEKESSLCGEGVELMWRRSRAYVEKIVKDDVSMCVSRRLISGYGVSDVRCLHPLSSLIG
jgi:hypothetical protein